jgi:hypothetical protein
MVARGAADIAPIPVPVRLASDEKLPPLEELCAGLLAENDRLRDENERLRGEWGRQA